MVLVTFLALQAVPRGRDHSNPAVHSEPVWADARTRELAARACFDCHSNETDWPWYSYVAPVSWIVEDDVKRGREILNFSEWERIVRSGHTLEPFAVVVLGDRSMPPPNYLAMHPEARLSETERDELVEGLQRTMSNSTGQFE